MFGDDVKMTVHSERRLCVGGEGEALVNPGAARPRNCSCSHQVTGKVKLGAPTLGRDKGTLSPPRDMVGGLNCPTKVGRQEQHCMHVNTDPLLLLTQDEQGGKRFLKHTFSSMQQPHCPRAGLVLSPSLLCDAGNRAATFTCYSSFH